MRFDVPFHSQFEGLTDPQWTWRGCGITALKMVLDFWHKRNQMNRTADAAEILNEGLRIGAYREGIGWTHGGLVALAQGYGYDAYNRDYAVNGPTPKSVTDAFGEMAGELERGPVLASVFGGFDPARGGGHIVVVTGTEGELIFLNDPEQVNAREGERIFTLDVFLRAFKRRYLCVIPRSITSG